ncbi:YdcF family protein [Vibrio chagasii]|nr:YdcF family protein [Vibrio chagasii]
MKRQANTKSVLKRRASCKVIISGGDAQNNGVTGLKFYEQQLLRLVFQSPTLSGEPNSVNTWKNAQLTSDLMKHHQFDNIVLVSSGLHIRRSELYFNRWIERHDSTGS